MVWNIADIFDAVAAAVPGERPAVIQGEHVTTWAQFDVRSNRLARRFLAAGLVRGDSVAMVSRNHPAYLEGFVACLKARLVPVNINYRYRAEEVAYVCRDAGVRGVLYQAEFAPLMAALQTAMPEIHTWVSVGGTDGVAGAVDYEAWAGDGDGTPLEITRSPEDPLLLYTGGTTGMPKGVIWPTGKYRAAQLESPLVARKPADLAEHVAMVKANAAPGRTLPAGPLMHGTGLNSALGELMNGGTAVILPATRFDADGLWQVVQDQQVTRVSIVGDAFARPMLDALEAAPGRYDLSRLKVITSAGLMWSLEVKQGLLRHVPHVTLFDALGASEASGMGYTITTVDSQMPTGRFLPGRRVALLTEDGRLLGPGVPGVGQLAQAEPLPAGYLGDPAKTAAVFREIDGERYSIPGDVAERFADGTMTLIGRGSLVINTGGEKVFVEEVEEAVKRLPSIADAMVVGVASEKWGSEVIALVRLAQGAVADESGWRRLLDAGMASYKVPKALFVCEDMPRGENGKGDYRAARALAERLYAARAAA
ncbi:AMP-binding protein [Achromobacter sp. GG226]|uniref:AMP-binding protein n=1 Tax=Verticiella alkaliphila TaxID=2779529 RepID=UPI001C0D3C28|nr:AMP-binding protein [Verticiella sp. GG226]MBU4610405.1 AMP-binding protein [Verticiella sp. GG226]